MNLILETERLILRPFESSDDQALFALDSNPNVHLYIENNPATKIEQVQENIKSLQNQYKQNGIGRFVVELKDTKEVIGWAGLKFITEEENGHVNFHDLGYRLREEFWRKGYAYEAATKWLDHAFSVMKIPTVYASAHIDNIGSNKILKKIGLQQNGHYLWNGLTCNWYELDNNTLSK